MLYDLARPLLFSLDAETAHELTIAGLHHVGRLLPAGRPEPATAVEAMGLRFPNRIGLAAGLDKNGEAIDGLARLGFGFLEIGTITPRPQPGNPRPRMFRLPEVRGIINRMGFNNHGVDALVANVGAAKYRGILGINIGKNADTPIERAADDYLACLDKVYALASYVTVNISSPNTRNLRQLQGESELDALLGRLKAAQTRLADVHGRYVPLTLKIAPDLEPAQTWETSLQWKRPIGQRGSVSVTGYYHQIDDVQDFIPVWPPITGCPPPPTNNPSCVFTAAGNIGEGERFGVNIEAAFALDSFISGAILKITGGARDSRVTDPITGQERRITNDLDYNWNIDFRQDLPELKVAVAYRIDGERVERFPAETSRLDRVEPVYESLPGWTEDLTGVRSIEKLPKNAKSYLKFLERALKVPVTLVSVGTDRRQTIQK